MKHHNIIIAGAGGIGQAAGLLLALNDALNVKIYFGDIHQTALDSAIEFVEKGSDKKDIASGFLMSDNEENQKDIFEKGDILLDCLPGKLAPKMARICLDYNMHYANLTEYVAETEQIKEMAKDANTGFVLQTGVAPGFVNILGKYLYEQFQEKYKTDTLELMEMKVGALSQNASAPHFYAFTWSTIGVATEYVKDAIIVENNEIKKVPSLSNRQELMLNGKRYEDNFTSGGAADFPQAFKDKIKNLHYKTLRYVGHYNWVKEQLAEIGSVENASEILEQRMLDNIPSVENDHIIIYCRVVGKDTNSRLRSINKVVDIYPQEQGMAVLRAIQSTTASSLCECARMLLNGEMKNGVNLQSQIDPATFLAGPFIKMVYGDVL